MKRVIEDMAEAAYETHCEVSGVEPNWGRGGFKTSIVAEHAAARSAASVFLHYLDYVVSDHPDPHQMEILTRFIHNVARNLDIELEYEDD